MMDIDLESVIVFFRWVMFLSGVLGMLIGSVLFFKMDIIARLNGVLNRRFSITEKIEQSLDRVVIMLDDFIMAKSKLVGLSVIVISILLIIMGLPGLHSK